MTKTEFEGSHRAMKVKGGASNGPSTMKAFRTEYSAKLQPIANQEADFNLEKRAHILIEVFAVLFCCIISYIHEQPENKK